jgi:hypothetical protein
MKQDILKVFSGKATKQFINSKGYDTVYGYYVWKGEVFCLKEGMDIPFDELTEKEQEFVHKEVLAGNTKINNALQ